jgi:hypothetical protein
MRFKADIDESKIAAYFERSRCPKCEIRMMLVGVEPSLLVPICARLYS